MLFASGFSDIRNSPTNFLASLFLSSKLFANPDSSNPSTSSKILRKSESVSAESILNLTSVGFSLLLTLL